MREDEGLLGRADYWEGPVSPICLPASSLPRGSITRTPQPCGP